MFAKISGGAIAGLPVPGCGPAKQDIQMLLDGDVR